MQSKIASCTSLIGVPASEHDIDTAYDTDLHLESHVYSAMSDTDGIDVNAITLNQVMEASASDPEIQLLVKTIMFFFYRIWNQGRDL